MAHYLIKMKSSLTASSAVLSEINNSWLHAYFVPYLVEETVPKSVNTLDSLSPCHSFPVHYSGTHANIFYFFQKGKIRLTIK